MKRFADLSRDLEFPMGIGLPGRVWRTGDPDLARGHPARLELCRVRPLSRPVSSARSPFRSRSHREYGASSSCTRTRPESRDDELFPVLRRLGRQIGQQVERRRAEEAVRQSEALRGAVLESALDCVITMNHEGTNRRVQPGRRGGPSDIAARTSWASRSPTSSSLRRCARPIETGSSAISRRGEMTIIGKRLELDRHARRRHRVSRRGRDHAHRKPGTRRCSPVTCATSASAGAARRAWSACRDRRALERRDHRRQARRRGGRVESRAPSASTATPRRRRSAGTSASTVPPHLKEEAAGLIRRTDR